MGKRRTSPKTSNDDDDVCPMDIDWDASLSVVQPPMKKARKAYIPKTLKIIVWANTFGLHVGQTMCPICKFNNITQMDFHCGHIVPECEGGSTTADNLQPICAKCNLSMGKKNMRDFHKKYFK